MLRRKKSGLRAMPSQIRDKDPNCRIPKSKKPALGLVFLNMVPDSESMFLFNLLIYLIYF